MADTEKTTIAIVISIAKTKAGLKVLCIRRSKASNKTGRWESAAGHIDDGETPLQAAKRELKEETGLESNGFQKQALSIKLEDPEKPNERAILFLHGPLNTEAVPTLNPKEHDAFKWVPVKELSKVPNTPSNFEKNIVKLLKLNKVNSTRQGSRMAESRSGVYALPSKMEGVILVGDRVEIFLDALQEDNPETVRGKVLRTDRNRFVIKTGKEVKVLDWNDRNSWEIVRVQRKRDDSDKTKTFTYEREKIGSNPNKLALIVEPDYATASDSMNTLASHPDMDRFGKMFVQQPYAMDLHTPKDSVVYRSLYEAVKAAGLTDDVTLTDLSQDRVGILISDSALIKKVLDVVKKNGVKVAKTRKAGLFVAAPVTTAPGVPQSVMDKGPDVEVTYTDPRLQQNAASKTNTQVNTTTGQVSMKGPLENVLQQTQKIQQPMGQPPKPGAPTAARKRRLA